MNSHAPSNGSRRFQPARFGAHRNHDDPHQTSSSRPEFQWQAFQGDPYCGSCRRSSTMPVITIVTRIEAPADLCFDLARSVELHVESTSETQERAVEGVTSGLLNL